MTRLLFSLLFLALSFKGFAAEPTIYVRLAKYVPSVLIEVKGEFRIYNPVTGALIATEWKNKRETARPSSKGIIFGDLFPGIHKMQIIPNHPNGSFLVNGIQYNGMLEIEQIEGALHIINRVDAENYIRSILTTHFPERKESALTDALAIISRTQAYYLIAHQGEVSWHVEADQVGYNGCSTFLHNPKIDCSVIETRGQILMRQQRPFSATWDRQGTSGLSLQQAAEMARKGNKSGAILKTFFPGARVEKIQ